MKQWYYWIEKKVVVDLQDLQIDFSIMSMPPYFVTEAYSGVCVVLTWDNYINMEDDFIKVNDAIERGYAENIPKQLVKEYEFKKQLQEMMDE